MSDLVSFFAMKKPLADIAKIAKIAKIANIGSASAPQARPPERSGAFGAPRATV
jgi:hypothetical protein